MSRKLVLTEEGRRVAGLDTVDDNPNLYVTDKDLEKSSSAYSYSIPRCPSWKNSPQPKYDEIVDKTDFRPDTEEVRALKNAGELGTSTPKYDYPDGKIPKDDPVTDVILALRSGKMDKADVQKLAEAMKEQADSEAKDSVKKAQLEKDAKALENRQKALDSKLGVNLPENE